MPRLVVVASSEQTDQTLTRTNSEQNVTENQLRSLSHKNEAASMEGADSVRTDVGLESSISDADQSDLLGFMRIENSSFLQEDENKDNADEKRSKSCHSVLSGGDGDRVVFDLRKNFEIIEIVRNGATVGNTQMDIGQPLSQNETTTDDDDAPLEIASPSSQNETESIPDTLTNPKEETPNAREIFAANLQELKNYRTNCDNTSSTNKCLTETTSEFPKSSNSNRYHNSKLRKNTLHDNSFEEELHRFSLEFPPMNCEEKVNYWLCDEEVSEVEDVQAFDMFFAEREKIKQKSTKDRKKATSDPNGSMQSKYNNFKEFKQMLTCQCDTRDNNNGLDKVGTNFMHKPMTAAEYIAQQRKMNSSSATVFARHKKLVHLNANSCTSESEVEVSPSRRSPSNVSSKNPRSTKFDKVIRDSWRSTRQKEKLLMEEVMKKSEDMSEAPNANNCTSKSDVERSPSRRSPSNASSETHRSLQFDGVIGDSWLSYPYRQKEKLEKEELMKKSEKKMKAPPPARKSSALTKQLKLKRTKVSTSKRRNRYEEREEELLKQWQSYNMPLPDETQGETELNERNPKREFCSYLGLSTADDLLRNAFLEAKKNIHRRSVRVRHLQERQQQKEKHRLDEDMERGKTANDDNTAVPSLRAKHMVGDGDQLVGRERDEKRERQQERSNYLRVPWAPPYEIETNSMSSFTPPIKRCKNDSSEIKIVCRISSQTKEDYLDKISAACAQKIMEPLRKKLLQSNTHTSDDYIGPDRPLEPLRLMRMSTSETCNKVRSPFDLQSPKLPYVVSNGSPRSGSGRLVGSSIIEKPLTPVKKTEHRYGHSEAYLDQSPFSANPKEFNNLESSLASLASLERFKKCLEASRQSKPEIYIVQALGDDPNTSKTEQPAMTVAAVAAAEQMQLGRQPSPVSNQSKKLSSRAKGKTAPPKKVELKRQPPNGLLRSRDLKLKKQKHSFLTRSTCNMSGQRQLRNRKVLIEKIFPSSTPAPVKNKKMAKASKVLRPATTFSAAVKKRRNKIPKKKTKKKSTNLTSDSVQRPPCPTASASTSSTTTTSTSLPSESESDFSSLSISAVDRRASGHSQDVSISSDDQHHIEMLADRQPHNFIVNGAIACPETETVIVSSTTNYHMEDKACQSAIMPQQVTVATNTKHTPPPDTKDSSTQLDRSQGGVYHLSFDAARVLQNPLKSTNGIVLHIYYERDLLIVVQECLVSFWKYSKLVNALAVSPAKPPELWWVPMGECKRQKNEDSIDGPDFEINSPYANRICYKGPMPVYVEMRCRLLRDSFRQCKLISLYVNNYFCIEETSEAKMCSIQLDTVKSAPEDVVYTTLKESYYFIVAWTEENSLGKRRTGLCKYAFAPPFDHLGSTREFKCMRHEILHLECTGEDKLLGFGMTQLSVWDSRSGDVLMNFDLEIPIGRNLGAIYYNGLDIGHDNVVILAQYLSNPSDGDKPQLMIIACSISPDTPSYRLLWRHDLPTPAFCHVVDTANTGEHLVVRAESGEEIWISCTDPQVITCLPASKSRRFYSRDHPQLIEMTDESLIVDTCSNYVLRCATKASNVNLK